MVEVLETAFKNCTVLPQGLYMLQCVCTHYINHNYNITITKYQRSTLHKNNLIKYEVKLMYNCISVINKLCRDILTRQICDY